MADVTISASGAHASAAATDRIPASKGPFTPGTKGYLTNEQIRAFIIATANAWAEDQTFSKGIVLSGNIIAAAWTTSGLKIKEAASTLTDSTSSGTVAAAYTHKLGGNTIGAVVATTFTDYFSAFLTEPTAGTNVTLTNRWALGLGGSLSVLGASLGGSAAQSALDIRQTWNTSGTPDGIKLTITDTASNAASNLLNLLVGASSKFNFDKSGSAFIGNEIRVGGSRAAPNCVFSNQLYFKSSATDLGLYWSATAGSGSALLAAGYEANNVWGQRNGTNAQTFRTYRTFTDASNYERAAIQTGSGYVEMAAETAGTGADDLDVRATPAGTGIFSSAASIKARSGTAIPAGGTAGAGVLVSSATNFGIFFGSGAPSLSAAQGSLYLRSDGSGIANRLYVNTDGGTTWTTFASAA
jgi:hypothetical protein